MLSVKPWKPEAVLFLFGGVFLCILAGAVLMDHMYPKALHANEPTFGSFLISVMSFQGATLVLLGFFVRKHQVRWRDAFGFTNKWKTSVLMGWVSAAAFLPVAYVLRELCARALEWVSQKPAEQEVVTALRAVHTHAEQAAMMVVVILIVPFVEEILFRGILYPLVKQAGFPRLALWGVSIFFATMHFNVVSFVPLVVLALLLTFLYETTDNLLAPIAAHSLFNAYGFVQLYLLNG